MDIEKSSSEIETAFISYFEGVAFGSLEDLSYAEKRFKPLDTPFIKNVIAYSRTMSREVTEGKIEAESQEQAVLWGARAYVYYGAEPDRDLLLSAVAFIGKDAKWLKDIIKPKTNGLLSVLAAERRAAGESADTTLYKTYRSIGVQALKALGLISLPERLGYSLLRTLGA